MARWLTPTPSDQPQQVEPGDNSRHSPHGRTQGGALRQADSQPGKEYPHGNQEQEEVGQDPERRCHGHAPNGGLAFPAVNDVRIVHHAPDQDTGPGKYASPAYPQTLYIALNYI